VQVRWRKLVAVDDLLAVARFQIAAVDAGRCDHIDGQTTVYIEAANARSGEYCIRPQGDFDCLWTGVTTIKKK
jgi:hypothetical protein